MNLLNLFHRSPSILRTNTLFVGGPDTTSRDDIISTDLTSSEWSWSYNTQLFSDAYFQTTFARFDVNYIVESVVAFSFFMTTSLLTSANIPFDVINIDIHNGWNKTFNAYTVQVAGVYVISYSVAGDSNQAPYVKLVINNSILVNAIHFDHTGRNGIETTSRTVLINAEQDDNLAINSYSGWGGLYSDIYCQTSMKGFLYKPFLSAPISWCVIEAAQVNIIINGPVDPLTFDTILVNQGLGWNGVINRFITPSAGIYYIHLTAGIAPTKPTNMVLLVNGSPFLNVYRQFTSHQGYDVRSHATILRLRQNDELRISLLSGYYLATTTGNGYIGFTGF